MHVAKLFGVLSTGLFLSGAFAMPYGIGCVTDLDTDGSVGVGDILLVIDSWGSADSDADINGDGVVTVADLLMLIDEWGTDCEAIHP